MQNKHSMQGSEIKLTKVTKKGWGCEKLIYNGEYCGKLLCFDAGKEGSAHFHLIKKESWMLMSGELILQLTDKETAEVKELKLYPNETITIFPGTVHKVIAVKDSVIFEVSTHHDDNDTYRVGKGSGQK